MRNFESIFKKEFENVGKNEISYLEVKVGDADTFFDKNYDFEIQVWVGYFNNRNNYERGVYTIVGNKSSLKEKIQFRRETKNREEKIMNQLNELELLQDVINEEISNQRIERYSEGA